MAYLLYRGEYDKRRDPVKADTPDALPPMPADLPRNRLGLATWLVRPEHPLTARVTVNRFWQEVFGTGLVRTTGDFGVTGELPSHPELLDWLAVEFRESGWDVKRLFRLMVESATYRQSAAATPEKLEKDPHNRLLSRGPRFRMDAEMIRDYGAVASAACWPARSAGRASSRTSPRGSGRPWPCPRATRTSTAPTTATGSTAAASTRSGSGARRRPRWTSSTPRPARSAPSAASGPTRPLQALVTLNDPQFVEAARALAESTLKDGGQAQTLRRSPRFDGPPRAGPPVPARGAHGRPRLAREARGVLPVAPRPGRRS